MPASIGGKNWRSGTAELKQGLRQNPCSGFVVWYHKQDGIAWLSAALIIRDSSNR